MKKVAIACIFLGAFAGTAYAGIEDRADEVKKNVQGKHGYHANMARELALVAVEEKSQYEVVAAGAFMDAAEKHVSMVGDK